MEKTGLASNKGLEDKYDNILVRICCCIAITAALLLSLIDLSEFYNVRMQKNGDSHPFGSVNQNPWYYRSEVIYWQYMVISGITFLAASVFVLVSMMKRKWKWASIGTGVIGLLFIFSVVNINTP